MCLDELEAFGLELVALTGEHGTFVVAGGFELVEHPMEHCTNGLGFIDGEVVGVRRLRWLGRW
ncbi:hypothetical protein EF847_17295 [Actinobacteria bacterium YIM 96077]|nr:hypothetical protein EF847_17295 [Actinobacteria bacterium YIM 96077]